MLGKIKPTKQNKNIKSSNPQTIKTSAYKAKIELNSLLRVMASHHMHDFLQKGNAFVFGQ